MDWRTRIAGILLWTFLVLSSISDAKAEQRVVCYYTNWSVYRPGTAKFSPQNINPYLCTHLIYAFGGFTKDNALKPFDKYQDIEKGGYAKFTGLKTYNKELKTMLAIGGWNEGSSRFSPMVADPDRRRQFVKNTIKFLRQNHFDGLDLDWEYPAFRDGGKPRDKNNYADLVQELREEFERESSKSGRPRLLLSMAVPAGIEYINKGYDIPRLDEYLDFMNLLSYDYHSAYEPAANHHSPLYPLEEDNEYNYDTELTIDYTIKHLLKSGASSEKIVLGIPTYGRSYTLFNADATEIGAPADGPGEEGDATREKGYLAYYEICESVGKSDEWEVVQPNPNAMGPYAFRGNQWVGYDDEDIVKAKARYVNEKNLGGIMFWSIDNDDFRGNCHGRPYPLIEAAKEALLSSNQKSDSRTRTRISENRKKTKSHQTSQRSQSGSNGRKFNAGRRTSTESIRPRVLSNKSNARSNNKNTEDEDNDDDDEEREERVNSVKSVEKPKTRTRAGFRNRSNGPLRKKSQNSRRNDNREKTKSEETSSGNKLTTPEPPTTPDPGTDFKCEDEGFFPHPRDCKKYFWCLDSGPSGLGVVAHQFTCPSGLVFNKAADSCDYPRNVVCPKKTSEKPVTTTTTTTTSTTTKSPAKTTTESEEYEYYDDDDLDEEEESIEDSRQKEEQTTRPTTPKTYKTISRARTTSTEVPTTTTRHYETTRPYETTIERGTSLEEEQDPRVIKELIDLIKKAGGIEQLEKQLLSQDKSEDPDKKENGKSTPATISRSLYERVLNRQATRINGGSVAGLEKSLSTTQKASRSREEDKAKTSLVGGFINGPGGAQFEGLDKVPEVKTLRRTNKHQYVTIERQRQSSKTSVNEDQEQRDEEDSSENKSIGNHAQRENSDRRIHPNYVNIRRTPPSTTTSENDVDPKEEKNQEDKNDSEEEDEEEEVEEPLDEEDEIIEKEKSVERSSSPKSRYTNIHRFRSTTLRAEETSKTDSTTPATESTVPVTEEPSTTTKTPQTSTVRTESSVTVETTEPSLKLVENSATEILLTTLPASSSLETRGTTLSAVSQPRPFGFSRRERTTTTPTVSTITPRTRTRTTVTTARSVSDETGSKVNSTRLKLPTLKEIVYPSVPPSEETIARREDDSSDRTSGSEVRRVFDLQGQIADNEILPSEEIERESYLGQQSSRRVEFPVKILIDNDGEDREEEAELILLRIPENKLDSTILKPIFRVKLLPGVKSSTERSTTSSPIPIPITRKRQRIIKARRRLGTSLPTTPAYSGETISEAQRAFYITKKISQDSSEQTSWPSEFSTTMSEFTTRPYSEGVAETTVRSTIHDEKVSIELTTPFEEETETRLRGDLTIDETSRTTFSNFNSLETQKVEETLGSSTPNPTTVPRTTFAMDFGQETTSSEPSSGSDQSGFFEETTVPIISTFNPHQSFSRNPVQVSETMETQYQMDTHPGSETMTSSLTTPSLKSTTETSLPSTLLQFRDESIATSPPSTLLVDEATTMMSNVLFSRKDNSMETSDEISIERANAVENSELTNFQDSTRPSSSSSPNISSIDEATTTYKTTELFDTSRTEHVDGFFTMITTTDRIEINKSEENSGFTVESSSRRNTSEDLGATTKTIDVDNTEETSRPAVENYSSKRKILKKVRVTTEPSQDESEENLTTILESRSSRRKIAEKTTATPKTGYINETEENPRSIGENISSRRKLPDKTTSTTTSSQVDGTEENLMSTLGNRSTRKRIPEEIATKKQSFINETEDNSKTIVESLSSRRKLSEETSTTIKSIQVEGSEENLTSTLENRSLRRKISENTVATAKTGYINETEENPRPTVENYSRTKLPEETLSTTKPSEVDKSEENLTAIPESRSFRRKIPEIEENPRIVVDNRSSRRKSPEETRPTPKPNQIDGNEENQDSILKNRSSRRRIPGQGRATTKSSQIDVTEENSKSTVKSRSSTNRRVSDEGTVTVTTPITIEEEKTSKSTIESQSPSRNEVSDEPRATSPMPSSVNPSRSKVSRGRFRFSNTATVESARPVKQLVVRRRPAKGSRNATVTSEEKEKNTENISNSQSEDKKNSTEPTRRRVVVYRTRERPETTSTTSSTISTTLSTISTTSSTTALPPTTSNIVPEVDEDLREETGGRRTRGKWRKRLVMKRPRTEVARADDQSIAESEHIGLALDEDIAEVSPLKKNILGLQRPLLARPNFKSGTRISSNVRSHDPTYEIRTDDQSTRAQELAPALLHPPTSAPTTTTESGRAGLLRKSARKISTTLAPRTTSASIVRRGPSHIRNLEVTTEKVRPRRPAIVDYDYYVDDEIRLVLKPELKDKLFITRKGGVRCLDQGNFPHPTSCNKFITCARMVNGQVLGTEYTCPDKLSFDPVGGICNWSAGLGCQKT